MSKSRKNGSSNKKSKNEKDFNTRVDEIMETLQENYQQQKKLMNELKELRSTHQKEIKVASGKSIKQSGKNSGFNKPQPVPEPLKKLLDIDEDLSRSMVLSLLYQYFGEHDMKNGREINPDKKIRQIFGMDDDDIMNFYNLNTWLKKIYQEHSIKDPLEGLSIL